MLDAWIRANAANVQVTLFFSLFIFFAFVGGSCRVVQARCGGTHAGSRPYC